MNGKERIEMIWWIRNRWKTERKCKKQTELNDMLNRQIRKRHKRHRWTEIDRDPQRHLQTNTDAHTGTQTDIPTHIRHTHTTQADITQARTHRDRHIYSDTHTHMLYKPDTQTTHTHKHTNNRHTHTHTHTCVEVVVVLATLASQCHSRNISCKLKVTSRRMFYGCCEVSSPEHKVGIRNKGD